MLRYSFIGMILLLGGIAALVVFVVVIVSVAAGNKTKSGNSESYDYQESRHYKNLSTISPSVVLFFLLVVGGIFFTIRTVSLSNTVRSLENQMSDLNHSIWQSNNAISSLRGELNNLQTEDDYVERFSYDFETVTDEGEGILDLSLYMKKLPTEGTVNLVIENSESEITMIELESDTMIFHARLTLNLDESYDLSVVIVDGEETLREELRTLDMNRMLNSYRGIKIEEDWDEENFIFVFQVYNDYSLNELLAFKEVWIEKYNEDGLISTELLTVPDVDVNSYQEYHFNVLMSLKIEYNMMLKITAVDDFDHEIVLFDGGF